MECIVEFANKYIYIHEFFCENFIIELFFFIIDHHYLSLELGCSIGHICSRSYRNSSIVE